MMRLKDFIAVNVQMAIFWLQTLFDIGEVRMEQLLRKSSGSDILGCDAV
jgi:hypothetical protein